MFNYQGMLSLGSILKVYRNNKCFLILFWNKLKLKTWSTQTWVYLRPWCSKFYNLESKCDKKEGQQYGQAFGRENSCTIDIHLLWSSFRAVNWGKASNSTPIHLCSWSCNHNPRRFVPHSEQNLDVSRMYGMPHSSQNFGGPAGCCLDIVKCQ
jgi:hypothetical protein